MFDEEKEFLAQTKVFSRGNGYEQVYARAS